MVDIDFNNLMQQAQEMQKRMQDVQRDIASVEVEGTSGAGLVRVKLSGRYECKRVVIDPGVLDDVSVLEDLIAAAFNDAVHKVDETTRGKMASLTAGMDLPADFKLPES
jgi:nucleoid-associated protein EbfC